MAPLLYLSLLFIELVFLVCLTFYLLSLIYSSLMGSPYVPTRKKLINTIIQHLKLKKSMKILELGCGDGRFLREASKQYKTSGLGIDINPIVVFIAKIKARMQKIKNIEFRVQNIFKTDMAGYDVIYLFLMPKLLEKMLPRLREQIQPSTLIISHGFRIPGCNRYITKTITGEPFHTYFYRFPKVRKR